MSEQERVVSRQRLGRRLGQHAYYAVAEQSADHLVLESLPRLNRGPGLKIIAGGVALLLVAVLILISGAVTAGEGGGFGPVALAAVLGGLIGGLGITRITGGYAVITTRNRIIADAASGTLSFFQGSRVGKERSQILRFDQIGALRLRRRPLLVGWILRRIIPLVALEIVVGADKIWIVDSAVDAEELRPAAEGLSKVLEMEIEST